MNETTAALVASFEAAAKTAQAAEAALRKTVAAQIARLECERALAVRRTRLIRMLSASAEGLPTEEEAIAAQWGAVRDELGWHAENEAHQAILQEMTPLARLVWQCACAEEAGPVENVR